MTSHMDVDRLAARLSVGHGPLYRRLVTLVREAVRDGEIGAGSRLPSERTLAAGLNVSRTTVINAYRMLRDEGLLEGERGSGTRVVGTPMTGPPVPASAFATSKVFWTNELDVIDLSSSVIAGPPPPMSVAPVQLPGDLGAPRYEPLGLPMVRDQIAARYTARGAPTVAGDILVTSGAQQAISLTFTLFARDGGPVVVEAPTYAGALDAARAAGVPVVSLRTGPTGPDLAALHALLVRHRPALVYLMTSVHNPTGTTVEPSRRRAVLQLAAEHDVLVADDETLSDLAFDENPRTGPPADIVIGSLDKTCAAGLRIGWIRAPEAIMTKLARLKATADLGSSAPSQLVASQLLPRLDEIAAGRREQLRERLELAEQLLREHLPSWTWTSPVGGMFLWVRIPYGDAETLAEVALRHGVRVLPGPRTSADGDFTDRLRLSFTPQPEVLRAGVERLRDAWSRIEPTRPADRVAIDLTV